MTPELDRSLDASARLIAEMPAAVALFDRDLRYVVASAAWIDAFALAWVKLAGCRHDEVCAAGQAALEHAQRSALAGENVDHCPPAANASQETWGAALGARPYRDSAGRVAGIVVMVRTVDKPVFGDAVAPEADPPAGPPSRLAKQLRQAFESGEFLLHYQPVFRFEDNCMVGAEALLRWNHPSEGLVPSAAFVPVLEETGLIAEVGCWVIREAIRQVETWRRLYGRNIVEWVGVNLSPRQLHDPSALLGALRGFHAGGFAVNRLKLEIAETALLHRPDAAGAVVAELRRLGIGFAIDNFGKGAASLDSLRRYPVDTIKIDGGLIAQIGTADGERLLRALLESAQMSGAAVIAERIESAIQREFLRRNGCGFGQGYLLAEPMHGALLGAFALTHAVNAGRAQSDISRSVTGRVMRRGA